MSDYLRYFPNITYQNKVVKDITKRIRFADTVGSNPFVFLPYVVKESETAEELSFHYYDSVDYVWLLYLANDIIDPKYDWPMNQGNLENFIIDKYKEQANATGRSVLAWSQNRFIFDNILYYENSEGLRINTYRIEKRFTSGELDRNEWLPFRAYDYEFERNENKRHIKVVDKIYAEEMSSDVRELLRGITT